MSIKAMKQAMEGLDKWGWGNDPRGADDYITALSQAIEQAEQALPEQVLAQRQPLTIDEIEAILARWNYETHGDRARYIVRETEAAHGIKETACT